MPVLNFRHQQIEALFTVGDISRVNRSHVAARATSSFSQASLSSWFVIGLAAAIIPTSKAFRIFRLSFITDGQTVIIDKTYRDRLLWSDGLKVKDRLAVVQWPDNRCDEFIASAVPAVQARCTVQR